MAATGLFSGSAASRMFQQHVPSPSNVIWQRVTNGLLLQLDHVAVPVPGDIGLYDIQTTLPGLVSPTSAGLDALMEFGPDGIEAILRQACCSGDALDSQSHRGRNSRAMVLMANKHSAFVVAFHLTCRQSPSDIAGRGDGGRGAAAAARVAAYPRMGGASG